MKNVKVVTIGIVFSWIVLQMIYVPFTEYFLKSSRLYAFSRMLEMSDATFHHLTAYILIISVCMISISIGMIFAILIYGPFDSLVKKIRFKSIAHTSIDRG